MAAKFGDETALADTGLSADQQKTPLACRSLASGLHEKSEWLAPAYQDRRDKGVVEVEHAHPQISTLPNPPGMVPHSHGYTHDFYPYFMHNVLLGESTL